jgi:hypothetical protein
MERHALQCGCRAAHLDHALALNSSCIRCLSLCVSPSFLDVCSDGELDKSLADAAFEDWVAYVGQEDEFEEMSIPPIA